MSSQVLLYHGVTKYKSIGIENYSGKHIKKSIFEKQMKFLKKYKKVVPFRDIMKSVNSIAITFDDTFRGPNVWWIKNGYWHKQCAWGKEEKFEKVKLNKKMQKKYFIDI